MYPGRDGQWFPRDARFRCSGCEVALENMVDGVIRRGDDATVTNNQWKRALKGRRALCYRCQEAEYASQNALPASVRGTRLECVRALGPAHGRVGCWGC